MARKQTEELKAKLTAKKAGEAPVKPSDLLSTGSTLLNLACSGRSRGGFAKGKYTFLVGDSASGKTFLSMTCLAEAAVNKEFDDYRFVYDNAEDGMLMEVEKFFGKAVAERLEPPALKDGQPVFSSTVEEFYFHVDDALKKGKPFIYILDSMDALSTEEEGEKFQAAKEAHTKGKDAAGSYGTSKAKANSAGIRQLLPGLRDSGSILLVISQTRDNIGFGFEKKTRSGGHALRFYATLELWSSVIGKLKKKVRGKDRQQGILTQVRIKKNRLTGRERSIEIPIYHSSGIDDVGSMVDYLLEENHWKASKGVVTCPEWNFEGTREQVITHVENNDLEKELRMIVAGVWQDIEEACAVQRKRRYE